MSKIIILKVPKENWKDLGLMSFPFVVETRIKRIDGEKLGVSLVIIDSKNREKFIKKARPNYEDEVEFVVGQEQKEEYLTEPDLTKSCVKKKEKVD